MPRQRHPSPSTGPAAVAISIAQDPCVHSMESRLEQPSLLGAPASRRPPAPSLLIIAVDRRADRLAVEGGGQLPALEAIDDLHLLHASRCAHQAEHLPFD